MSSSLSNINNLKSITRSRGKAAFCNTRAPASSLGLQLRSCVPFCYRERATDFSKDFQQDPSHKHEEANVRAWNWVMSTDLPAPIGYGELSISNLLCREKPFKLLQNRLLRDAAHTFPAYLTHGCQITGNWASVLNPTALQNTFQRRKL